MSKEIIIALVFNDVDDDVNPEDIVDFINGAVDDLPYYILDEEYDIELDAPLVYLREVNEE